MKSIRTPINEPVAGFSRITIISAQNATQATTIGNWNPHNVTVKDPSSGCVTGQAYVSTVYTNAGKSQPIVP